MVDWIIDQFLKKSSLYGGKVLIAKRRPLQNSVNKNVVNCVRFPIFKV